MVKLELMNENEFGEWRENHSKEYAEEKVKSGAWSADEAPRLADEEYIYTAVGEATGEEVEHIGGRWSARAHSY
ncbi:MAG: hypothetical protein ABIO92_08470 [Chloroflexia bacterium]